MSNKSYNLALMIDMENVNIKDFNLEKLTNTLLTSEDDSDRYVFVTKRAYGNLSIINDNLKNQVINHNFEIINTPKVTNYKNRADLQMSLDAFELLYQGNPKIDRFCFITSDVDFTVIGDKLRKYGMEVWLVCKEKDKGRVILSKSFDKLLFLEDFPINKESEDINKELFMQALSTITTSTPFNISKIYDKMRRIDPSYDIKKTKYKKFINLVQEMEKESIISTFKKENLVMVKEIIVI